MRIMASRWALGAAAAAMLAVPAAAQSVQVGVEAWQRQDYQAAVRAWRPLAERGDADAQFNLGHAYRLGRGVEQNLATAEQYYARAARTGHAEAGAMYGLLLFQNGRRSEGLPYIQRAAEAGDPRAQYVYGTALFNGDLVERDWPRAYALMRRAAEQGLPPARTQLAEMERHLSQEDRSRGEELARAIEAQAPTRVAAAVPTPSVAVTQVPASRPPQPRGQAGPAGTQPPPARSQPSRTSAPAPAQPPAATGRWRVQLGAFSSDANARRAWSQLSGRLPGLQPHYSRAGALVRLQAGPLPDRTAAERACAAVRGAGGACFAVAP